MVLNVSHIVRPVAVFILMLFLGACSIQSTQSTETETSLFTSSTDNELPVEIHELLTANSQDVSALIPSGLNEKRHLTASNTYFAASGRYCRKVVISDDLADEQYVACSVKADEWEFSRLKM